MTPESQALLRQPFEAQQVGKLPRLTCKACTDARGVCSEHRKAKCEACGNYLSTAHIDLDYVGHAAVTDRLLAVDPMWSWEPLATDERGLPAYDNAGGLWIRLTVCGVTRLGYGDGPDPKQRIGDALRNAAMRFGVALDLWHKGGDLHDDNAPQETRRKPERSEADLLRDAIREEGARTGQDAPTLATAFFTSTGEDIRDAGVAPLSRFLDSLRAAPFEQPAAAAPDPAEVAARIHAEASADDVTRARLLVLIGEAEKDDAVAQTVVSGRLGMEPLIAFLNDRVENLGRRRSA